ncbi:MAG: hypothetical protein AAFX50_03705 [Acidobacteriota bacterium]
MRQAEALVDQARRGRLYPSVILYGGSEDQRRALTLELARTLLCEKDGRLCVGAAASAGADACRHCRRMVWPEKGAERFHPDLHVLERDLRTTTSIDATKTFASKAVSAPFEARGQVFVVAEADTLSGGGADALLKLLEEPPSRSPRHFILLAASRHDLQVTLRSRSLAVFLGPASALPDADVEDLTAAVGASLDRFFAGPSALHLLSAADAVAAAGKSEFKDPRARRPWALGAAALTRYATERDLPPRANRALLTLAEDLLDAPRLRLRGIQHGRILEGLFTRRLADL